MTTYQLTHPDCENSPAAIAFLVWQIGTFGERLEKIFMTQEAADAFVATLPEVERCTYQVTAWPMLAAPVVTP